MLMDRLVGRAEELAYLRDRVDQARGGAGHLVVVTGPAGIGKTRLVEEVVRARADLVVGWGATVDDPGMPALWPWTRALRHLPAPRSALARLAAGAALGEHASAEDAAAATFAADTAVVDALEAEAQSGTGLLIVLDDLQWADQSTRRLLERLAAEVRRMPILIVCTQRDTIGDSTPSLATPRSTAVLNLRPLTPAESATLLAGSVADADPGQVRRGAEISGGSPLYLRTLTRVAAPQLRGTSAWSEVGEQPELRHLILTALRGTGEDTARCVGALSVLGQDAEPELLARVLGLDSAADALERIQPAAPAGLVEVVGAGGGRVRFAHALVRDAAYASLPPSARTAMHRRAAEVLAPLAVVREEQAGAVAHHWYRAGEPSRAVEWAIRAADTALAGAAYEDAITYLTLALEVRDRDLEPGTGIDRCRAAARPGPRAVPGQPDRGGDPDLPPRRGGGRSHGPARDRGPGGAHRAGRRAPGDQRGHPGVVPASTGHNGH
jgi:predicted ATPase